MGASSHAVLEQVLEARSGLHHATQLADVLTPDRGRPGLQNAAHGDTECARVGHGGGVPRREVGGLLEDGDGGRM